MIINQVIKTNDYNTFKVMPGNRPVNKLHVRRLSKSMEEKHLMSPILVNEKMQVIDGQHRLEAQKSDQIEDMFGTDGAKNIFAKLEGFKNSMKRTYGIKKDDREMIDDKDNPGTQIVNKLWY